MRSKPLFVLSLVCLTSAALLGGVLVYDGAVSELAAVQPGDHVRIQAESQFIGTFEGVHHYLLDTDDDLRVHGTSLERINNGVWVFEAIVLEHEGTRVTLQLESWREPVIEA